RLASWVAGGALHEPALPLALSLALSTPALCRRGLGRLGGLGLRPLRLRRLGLGLLPRHSSILPSSWPLGAQHAADRGEPQGGAWNSHHRAWGDSAGSRHEPTWQTRAMHWRRQVAQRR